MSPWGIAIYLTGCLRLHKDGDGVSGVFRFWHPLTWIILVVMVLPCALMGEKLTSVVPLRLSKFWTDNIGQLQRVTPWTKLSTLKPFRHKPLNLQGADGPRPGQG